MTKEQAKEYATRIRLGEQVSCDAYAYSSQWEYAVSLDGAVIARWVRSRWVKPGRVPPPRPSAYDGPWDPDPGDDNFAALLAALDRWATTP
jgi:hypothetical protein